MLNRLSSLSPRRLVALGLVAAAIGVGVLLIILWQVGLFDSAPPPASLESAVESVRQDAQADQSVQQAEPAAQQTQSQQTQADAEPSDEQTSDEQAQPQLQQQQTEQAQPSPSQQQQTADSTADQQASQSAQQTQAQATDDEEPQQSQSQQATQQSTEDAPQQQESVQQSAQQQATTNELGLGDLAGTWTLSQQGTSFVGYRIGEELANIGTVTAVGRTSDIVATLDFDGASIQNVVIEADLRTLTSDQSFRDGALRTRGIESDLFPFATFTLTEPIAIDALHTAESTLSVTVQGTLDLHGVTNAVSIALEGQFVDGLVVVVGSTEIALADYDIEKPTGFRVLSIEDVGIMEFQLVLERAR